MRVISGKCKGTPLKAVPGNSTRPTTDKVKEAVFNMIGPFFDNGLCLDLFAGSGGLGIEALSRGMERAIFVDQDGKAIRTIHNNLKTCQLEPQAEVYRNDAFRALRAIIKRNIAFDAIFLDPPYNKYEMETLLGIIDTYKLINNDGIVVCEHHADKLLPEQIGNLYKSKEEIYGIISVSIYKWTQNKN